jgi:hypothetical protein
MRLLFITANVELTKLQMLTYAIRLKFSDIQLNVSVCLCSIFPNPAHTDQSVVSKVAEQCGRQRRVAERIDLVRDVCRAAEATLQIPLPFFELRSDTYSYIMNREGIH